MGAHASTPGLAMAMAMMMGLSACKGRRDSAPDGQGPPEELAPGALMIYASGGGATGRTTHVTVFADGRVEGRESLQTAASHARVPAARVEKLAADLAATGVFALKDGSWLPSRPVADGSGALILVRDRAGAVHAYEWASGAKAPDAVARAMDVGGAFATEFSVPKTCACEAGDPLCSCL
jgi:hypothetical protein